LQCVEMRVMNVYIVPLTAISGPVRENTGGGH
jgi:hypothetical protein